MLEKIWDNKEDVMDYRKFGNTYVVRLDPAEEILEQLEHFARQEQVRLAAVQALGAGKEFTVGVFKTDEKKYYANHFSGSFEIVSLTGTIDTMDGDFYCHLHMSAGDDQGRVFGGHLNRAVISATCEMIVTLLPGTVDRALSEEVGLNLWKF